MKFRSLVRPGSTRTLSGLVALMLALVVTLLLSSASSNASSVSTGGGPKPTIVLVHGAFADASGWAGVELRLQRKGYTVIAPANTLRGALNCSRERAKMRCFV
jgi:pimeloyl-ACP methyl ester carboxylesterase